MTLRDVCFLSISIRLRKIEMEHTIETSDRFHVLALQFLKQVVDVSLILSRWLGSSHSYYGKPCERYGTQV